MEREDVIAKVKALWAKADDPAATPAEAQAFKDKATEIMAKYEIDAMVLDAGTNGEQPIVFGQFKVDDLGGYLVPDERIVLAGAIARNFECKIIVKTLNFPSADPNSGEKIEPGVYAEAIGYKHDFEMVKGLYFSLVVDMLTALFMESQKDKNYQREFASAYAIRIDQRLKAVHQRVKDWVDDGTVSGSVAIAIRSRLQKVQDKFDEMYPNTVPIKVKSTRYDPNARARGKAQADRADIGGEKLGGSSSSGSLGTAKKELGS